MRGRATEGDGSGSDGTAVERHGGLGRSEIDRQFPPLGVKAVPSYQRATDKGLVAYKGGA